MKNKDFLTTATIIAALAVALGAFGAHGLKPLVSPERLEAFKTGVQYQFYHAFAIALTVIISQYLDDKWLRRSAWLFLTGILLFSGSLYVLTYFSAINTVHGTPFGEGGKWVGAITPLGGVCFLLGWGFLTMVTVKNKS
jgi:uncharacterized membrane protein YgdD (TMEM256/DUF423 family)